MFVRLPRNRIGVALLTTTAVSGLLAAVATPFLANANADAGPCGSGGSPVDPYVGSSGESGPTGRYLLQGIPADPTSEPVTVYVRRTTDILATVAGATEPWGFSPDQDHFVTVVADGATPPQAVSYDLASADPGMPHVLGQYATPGSHLGFCDDDQAILWSDPAPSPTPDPSTSAPTPTESDSPTEPTSPTDSASPTESDSPTDPDSPTESTSPTEPTSPTDPTSPAEPSDSGSPTEPAPPSSPPPSSTAPTTTPTPSSTPSSTPTSAPTSAEPTPKPSPTPTKAPTKEPTVKPAKVAAPALRPGNHTVALTWKKTSGARLYVVQLRTTGSWTSKVTTASTTATIKSLVNGRRYYVRIAALNAAGQGAWSTTVSTAPRTVPGKPRAVRATAKVHAARISWSRPATNGGARVTAYVIQKRTSPGHWQTVRSVAPSARAATISHLVKGRRMVFRVVARNVGGYGAGSTAVAVRAR